MVKIPALFDLARFDQSYFDDYDSEEHTGTCTLTSAINRSCILTDTKNNECTLTSAINGSCTLTDALSD